jgi:hypothetical protein
MIAFIQAHQAVLAGAVVGLLDLLMALVPSLAANGILHSIVIFLQGKAQIAVAPPASS